MAEFSTATSSTKRRIIAQQLNPDILRIPWYQLPKARIKKSFELKGDLRPIQEAIQILLNRKPISKRQVIDRQVSLEAMQRFIEMKIPSIFKEIDFSIIKPGTRSTKISGVEVIVAPEIVVKGRFKNKTVIGGVKIHISKNNPFDLQKSQIVASAIETYLQNEVVDEDSIVLPELCICLDIYGGRIVSCSDVNNSIYNEVIEICNEIKLYWDAA